MATYASVTTIGRVARYLGEDEDWLSDVANGMDSEDGLIWVFGIEDDGVMAFTDFVAAFRRLRTISFDRPIGRRNLLSSTNL
jgi:hypothetical protein